MNSIEKNNLSIMDGWATTIFFKLGIGNPTNNHYLALLSYIKHNEKEPSKEEFFELFESIDDSYLIQNDIDTNSDDYTSLISILYTGQLNDNDLNDILKKTCLNIQSKINSLDLHDKVSIMIFNEKAVNKSRKILLSNYIKNDHFKISEIKGSSYKDIKQILDNSKRQKKYVEKFTFKIDSPNNKLIFNHSEDNSKHYALNIAASSIQKVYREYGENSGPLYRENLRYYIKNKKIDKKIEESIKNQSEKFWYKNNGIVVVCEDVEFVDNEIIISKFSFINGGQTTFMLGTTDFEKDFYVMVKVISTSNMTKEYRSNFIEDIAIATNSQKTIKAQDLLANDETLKNLQTAFFRLKPSLYLQLKRGVAKPDELKLKPELWRFLTLESVGQLGLATLLADPGKAKGDKSAIYESTNKKIIFSDEYANYYLELRKLWWSIDVTRKEWMKNVKKNDKSNPLLQFYATGQWYIFLTIIFTQLIRKDAYFKNLCRSDEILKKKAKDISNFFIENAKNNNFLKVNDLHKNNLNIMIRDSNIEFMIEFAVDSIRSVFEGREDQFSTFANYSKTKTGFFQTINHIVKIYNRKSSFGDDINDTLDLIFK